jgi:hypothetical protein
MKDNKVGRIFAVLLTCVAILSAAAVYPTTVAATTFNSGDSISEVELAAPQITGVAPSEPDAFSFRQWVVMIGSGFTGKSEVILRTGTEEYPIAAERILFVSASRIDVFVGLAEGAWTAQVINPDQPPSNEFTFNVAPHEGSIVASVHIHLLNYLDELIPGAGETEYFNDEDWDITREQYKIMIAALMWAEGAIHGYSAHSRAATDSVKHQDLDDRFRFSTGIGPMQLDRGGEPRWHEWPTIEKLDYKKALESTLAVHHDKMENITSLDNMRSQMKNTWFAYYLSGEWSPPRGHWEDTWSDVTGLGWFEVDDCDEECVLDITWEEVKAALSANAEKTWLEHEEVVQDLGYKKWKVDYTSDSGEAITIDGEFETYLITARAINYPVRYYYMNHSTQPIEVWAYCNPDSEYHLRSIFVRNYSPEAGYPDAAYPIDTGKTLDKPALYPDMVPEVKLDVFMLVDLTGSFSDDLPAFKAQAPDLMATLKLQYPDIRFGLGKFEDYPISPFGSASHGDKAYERLIDLTPDTDAVLDIIAGLYTSFGDDGPESQLVALYQAATGEGQDLSGVSYPGASIPAGQQANFRDGVIKLFILWTDAPFHRPEDPGSIPYPGPSFDETVEAILALDPPMVIGISSGGGGLADLEAIAAATGALAPSGGIDTDGDGIVDIPEGQPLVATIGYSGQGIAAAIESLVEAAAVLPIADTGGPYTGEVGDTILFDGSGSFDSDGWIVLYEWDFASDGVFDFSSTEPTAEYAYSAEFTGMVTLRVTDNDGNTAIGTAPVEILPRSCIPLKALALDPETLNLHIRGKWITAYIELPEGYSFEDIDIGTVRLLYVGNETYADRGDVQDGVLMVKFDRATVAGWFEGLHDEEVELIVAGEVNGIQFEGTDTIRVIDPPRPKRGR